MDSEEHCPHCGLSLKGDPVPGEINDYGSLKIGIEIRGAYDGILFWQCPSCEERWHRWPEGHYLRKVAEKYAGHK